ncbi:hypothetical protein [Variovorax arabinosiphilus]|nr:hypothetical protein [Variovorax sp. J2L1-63]MDM0130615.1 hypothetical protein [Variovorax sp. J2L1-63]
MLPVNRCLLALVSGAFRLSDNRILVSALRGMERVFPLPRGKTGRGTGPARAFSPMGEVYNRAPYNRVADASFNAPAIAGERCQCPISLP